MAGQTAEAPYPGALPFMARQLVDSSLSSTREFWRKTMGATDAEAVDPRPFAVALSSHQSPDAD